MSGRPAIAVLAALLLAIAAALWWTGRSGTGDDVPVDAAGAGAAHVAPRAPPPNAPAPSAWPELPPLDRPLRLAIADLRARADAGDPLAACRLATEAERCHFLAQNVQGAREQLERNDERAPVPPERREAMERARQQMRDLLARRERDAAHCEGVEPLAPTERVRYWRQAALAGHVPSMRRYASGAVFDLQALVDLLPQLATYREEAEFLARRAAAAGDLQAAAMLAFAYQEEPRRSPQGASPNLLRQVVRPDPRDALAWLQAVRAHPAVARLPDAHWFGPSVESALARAAERLPAGESLPAPASMPVVESGSAWPLPTPGEMVFGPGGVTRQECGARQFAGG